MSRPWAAQPAADPAGRPAFEPVDVRALESALARIGDRWSALIVHALLGGPLRFGDLRGSLDGIASNVLSQRLSHLQDVGVVVSRRYSTRPERFSYELTAGGAELAGPLRALAAWGARHGHGEPVRHAACGDEAEARWWCPTCARAIDDDELGDQRLV